MNPMNHRPPLEPFGQIAVRRGYVTRAQIDEALRTQKELSHRGEKHKPIGLIMLELGHLGTTELIEVLRDLQHPAPPPSPLPANGSGRSH